LRILPLIILIILLIPLVVSYEECKRITPSKDIPCRVTTTWTPPNSCSTYEVTIFNQSGNNISTLSLGNYGDTSYCIFNFSFTEEGDYHYNRTTADTGNILLQEADNMTSLSVTLFILLINIAIFLLPIFVKFTENPVLNNAMKKMVYILGLVFLAFNTTIIVSLAENAGLGVSTELFRYQFFFLWGIYISLIFLFFNLVVTTVQMWRVEKTKKRMGER